MNDPAQNPYASTTNTKGPDGHGPGQGDIAARARTGMIITFAMVNGVVFIGAILIYLVQGDMPDDQPLVRFDAESIPFLVIGLGAFVACLITAWLVPKTIRGRAGDALRDSNEPLPQPLDSNSRLPESASKYLAAEAGATLVGQAAMEGQAFLNLILVFLTQNYVFLIPAVIGIAGIAMQVPTAGKLKNALEIIAMRR